MPGQPMKPGKEVGKTSIFIVLAMALWYIGTSASLISFNKHLMSPGNFPFPIAIGLLHMCFCSLMAAILYAVKPGLFPSMTDPEKKINLHSADVWKAILPIAAVFGLQIVSGNSAYLYADISFLQMVKETGIIWVYILTVMFALETFQWPQFRLLCCIALACTLSVSGELNLSLAALSLQLFSSFGESFKISLQGLLLQSKGHGMDPLTYMLLVMPCCVCMFSTLVMFVLYWEPMSPMLQVPSRHDWVEWRWPLLLNACNALLLNFGVLVFIKVSSAISYVVAGILKDVAIVTAGCVFMGHTTSYQQVIGFTIQVSLISVWSLQRTFPKQFGNGIADGLRAIALIYIWGQEKETGELPDQRHLEYGAVRRREEPASGTAKTKEEPAFIAEEGAARHCPKEKPAYIVEAEKLAYGTARPKDESAYIAEDTDSSIAPTQDRETRTGKRDPTCCSGLSSLSRV